MSFHHSHHLYARFLDTVADNKTDISLFLDNLKSTYFDNDVNNGDELGQVTNLLELERLISVRHEQVLQDYSAYVERRRRGGMREMFHTKMHAKWYILQIAPTKLIDGAWLNNIHTVQDENPQVTSILLRTYLDEIGKYDRYAATASDESGHIEIYAKLMRSLYGGHVTSAADIVSHPLLLTTQPVFLAGCIQLALGALPQVYLPEIVGYNLGYEQLPYHLLVTAFELKGLEIDSQYFDLHISVDNFDCGHARLALDAAFALLRNTSPKDRADVFARMIFGMRLNDLAVDGRIWKEYNLPLLVENMFCRKASVAHALHRTVDLRTGDCLGAVMESVISSTQQQQEQPQHNLLDLMLNNEYFNQPDGNVANDFLDTRFYAVTRDKMLNSFTKDEMELIAEYFNVHVKSPTLQYESQETGDLHDFERICNIFAPVAQRHKNVLVSPHPDDNDNDDASCVNMIDLFQDKQQFYSCISSSQMRERIRNSFINGSMKNVRISPEDRNFVLAWCSESCTQ